MKYKQIISLNWMKDHSLMIIPLNSQMDAWKNKIWWNKIRMFCSGCSKFKLTTSPNAHWHDTTAGGTAIKSHLWMNHVNWNIEHIDIQVCALIEIVATDHALLLIFSILLGYYIPHLPIQSQCTLTTRDLFTANITNNYQIMRFLVQELTDVYSSYLPTE